MPNCPACKEEVKAFAKICPHCSSDMKAFQKQKTEKELYLANKYIKFTAPVAVLSFLITTFGFGWHWFWSGVIAFCVYIWSGKLAAIFTGED